VLSGWGKVVYGCSAVFLFLFATNLMSTANADLSIWRRNKRLHCLLCIGVITHSGGQGRVALRSTWRALPKGAGDRAASSPLWVRAGPSSPGVLFRTASRGPAQTRTDCSVPLGARVWALCGQRCPHHPPALTGPQRLADDTAVTDQHAACVK